MRLIIALRIANASSPFQTAIKFIFDGFQNEEVIFSNTIRSLLVDNILNNLDFITKEEIKTLKNLDFKNYIDKQKKLQGHARKLSNYDVFKNDYLKTQQGNIYVY